MHLQARRRGFLQAFFQILPGNSSDFEAHNRVYDRFCTLRQPRTDRACADGCIRAMASLQILQAQSAKNSPRRRTRSFCGIGLQNPPRFLINSYLGMGRRQSSQPCLMHTSRFPQSSMLRMTVAHSHGLKGFTTLIGGAAGAQLRGMHGSGGQGRTGGVQQDEGGVQQDEGGVQQDEGGVHSGGQGLWGRHVLGGVGRLFEQPHGFGGNSGRRTTEGSGGAHAPGMGIPNLIAIKLLFWALWL